MLDTRDRLFTKIVLQRHHATDAQTYISILLADATYSFSTILAIKEVAILG